MVFYNEIEPFMAAWLRELIAAGHIADGVVDERDIADIRPDELAGFTQCHFFAGLGGWSRALRLAEWPDDRPVWTGSCPCQPFSAAGKRGGMSDERHLWPAWFHLIEQYHPDTVFGEQVASKDVLAWLDLVHADLEGAGYTVGAADICAAGVGAPHIRQRLYFVANSESNGFNSTATSPRTFRWWATESCNGSNTNSLGEHSASIGCRGRSDGDTIGHDGALQTAGLCADGELADTKRDGWDERGAERKGQFGASPFVGGGGIGELAVPTGRQDQSTAEVGLHTESGERGNVGNTSRTGREGHRPELLQGGGQQLPAKPGAVNGFWADAEWLPCRDGKARPVEPGTFPLAYGVPARVGRLRGYGNAIVPYCAAEFIRAYMM